MPRILLILLACSTAAALSAAARARKIAPADRRQSPARAALVAGLLAALGASIGIAIALWRAT